YGGAQLRLCDELYPKPHPYYDCVIGTVPEIQGASMDDLKNFFRSFYTPNNASLAIVGDFKPEEVKPIIEKYFGPIPKGPDVKRPDVPSPVFEKSVEATVEDPNIDAARL